MKNYPKYTWIGNRVDPEDMQKLYQNKKVTKKHITIQIREAVKDYIKKIEIKAK